MRCAGRRGEGHLRNTIFAKVTNYNSKFLQVFNVVVEEDEDGCGGSKLIYGEKK